MKASSRAMVRNITALDQYLRLINKVDAMMVKTMTGMIGWPK